MWFNVTRVSSGWTQEFKPCYKAICVRSHVPYEDSEPAIWSIEFKNLDELMSFTSVNGKCIIDSKDGQNNIIIYDDYRE